MRLSQYIAPTAEPIHLTEAKIHLRLAVDSTTAAAYTREDDLLRAAIAAVRQVAETETWKALVLQTHDLFLDDWPMRDEIPIPLPPLRRIDSVTYTTSDGVAHNLATTEYEVDTDSTPGRIVLAYDKVWPSDTLAPKNPIKIRFSCGYLVPFTANASTDVLTAAGHPFADGDMVRLSVSGGSLPTGLSAMTDYFVRDAAAGSLKLAATAGGSAIDITSAGSGSLFIGEAQPAVIAGMKLVLTDLYENRADTITERLVIPYRLPRAATHLFAMDSARKF